MDKFSKTISYGLRKVKNKSGKIKICRGDLMFIFFTLEELVSFFHNRMHYPDLKAVKKFIGNKNHGAYKAMSTSYYKKLCNNLPKDIMAQCHRGELDYSQHIFNKKHGLTSR